MERELIRQNIFYVGKTASDWMCKIEHLQKMKKVESIKDNVAIMALIDSAIDHARKMINGH